MQREGSAFSGLGVVMLKELSDHLTSVRMRVLEWLVVLVALAALYGAIQQIKDTTAEDPFLFLRLFTTSRDPLPSFVSFLSLPGAVDGDRARVRFRQQRVQPPHALAHPVAADLSRRAVVRQIPRPACYAADQPGRAVAARDRARPADDRHSAGRAKKSRAVSSFSWSPSSMPACGSRWRCCFRSCSGRRRPRRWSRSGFGSSSPSSGRSSPARSRRSSCRPIRAIRRSACRRQARPSWSKSSRGSRPRPYAEVVVALLDPTTRALGPIYLSQLQGAVLGAPLPLSRAC